MIKRFCRKALALVLFFAWMPVSASIRTIQFESPFPDSPYRSVQRFCIIMWHYVRTMNRMLAEETLSEKVWSEHNQRFIGSLVSLSHDIDGMLEHVKSCSPDDLEYLMGMLHVMHIEYMGAYRKYCHQAGKPLSEECICVNVLFDFIKNKLGKALP